MRRYMKSSPVLARTLSSRVEGFERTRCPRTTRFPRHTAKDDLLVATR